MKIKIIKFLLKDLKKEEKTLILMEAIKDLYNIISSEDVLRFDGENWYFGGKKQTKDRMGMLAGEAGHFLESRLWKVLEIAMKNTSNEKMYIKSQTNDDLNGGKIMLFFLQEQKKLLKAISKIK